MDGTGGGGGPPLAAAAMAGTGGCILGWGGGGIGIGEPEPGGPRGWERDRRGLGSGSAAAAEEEVGEGALGLGGRGGGVGPAGVTPEGRGGAESEEAERLAGREGGREDGKTIELRDVEEAGEWVIGVLDALREKRESAFNGEGVESAADTDRGAELGRGGGDETDKP